MYKKQLLLFKHGTIIQFHGFKRGYMINDNENEAKNEKQVTKIQNKQAQAQTWT